MQHLQKTGGRGVLLLTRNPSLQSAGCLCGNPSSAAMCANGTCPDLVGALIPLHSFDLQLSVEGPDRLGTVNFQPCHPLCRPSGLIEREGKEKQFLVALHLQSNRRSRWQSLERTTQTIQRSHRLG